MRGRRGEEVGVPECLPNLASSRKLGEFPKQQILRGIAHSILCLYFHPIHFFPVHFQYFSFCCCFLKSSDYRSSPVAQQVRDLGFSLQ